VNCFVLFGIGSSSEFALTVLWQLFRRIQNFSLCGGGCGGCAYPEAKYSLFDFTECVTKIISESQSRHLVRLQGKIKTIEKGRVDIFWGRVLLYFSTFQCTSYQPISVADLG